MGEYIGELVRSAMEKGKFLTTEAMKILKTLPREESERIVNSIQKNIITDTEIKSILYRWDHSDYEVVMDITEKPPQTIETQINWFNSKYQKISGIISNKIDKKFVSIEIIPLHTETWLIGIIRDIKEGEKTSIVVEDPTGSINVIFEKKIKCDLDDVVAIRGSANGKIFYGKEVVYPDVPLRTATRGNGRACFISDLHLEEAPASDFEKLIRWINDQNIDWVFVAGDIGNINIFEESFEGRGFVIPGERDDETYPSLPIKSKKHNIISMSNPCAIKVGGLIITLIHNFLPEMIHKRHLGTPQWFSEEDFLAMTWIPDIIHRGHDHKPFVSNYKSISIINSGSLLTSLQPVIIDFKSRECRQFTNI